MLSYHPPVDDTLFVLENVAGLPQLLRLPHYEGLSTDIVAAVLTQFADFVSNEIAPLNMAGDLHGCTRQSDRAVLTPPGFKAVYDRFISAGWTTLMPDKTFGGQGFPHAIWLATEEYMAGANLAFSAYTSLTSGAIGAIFTNASSDLQARFLPEMVAGRWSGTMNLTEPQCGTDLGLIRTKAVPRPDGIWDISGTKIFISAGEHDLTENIVHLVLAKTHGAPDNAKGLSLFIVPKFLPDKDGKPGKRNNVACGSIEHKMGLHGNSTCIMNYEGAQGWLIGREGQGLGCMFVMMNEARLHVGVQGLGVAGAAYQAARAYAEDRRQGRAPAGAEDPNQPADLLIVHPDVRRMLMECRALSEGARALCLWTAVHSDLARHAESAGEREVSEILLALMTPVVKAFVSTIGFRCATTAQQVFGGHGYIRENGVEQLVRDARITMIYEGTNGVQAMDLVGRKLFNDGGRAVSLLCQCIEREMAASTGECDDLAKSLREALNDYLAAVEWLGNASRQKPEELGAAASDLLDLQGYLALGWMWLAMANAAARKLEEPGNEASFFKSKLAVARFYMRKILPTVSGLLIQIKAGSDTVMAVEPWEV